MGDFVRSASAILSSSQQRAEQAAHNIANITTPGFRAKHSFTEALNIAGELNSPQMMESPVISLTPGQISPSGGPFDLAIDGSGFFVLRGEDGLFYTRNGQFTRDADGRLLGVGGRYLQAADGGDVMLPDGLSEIRSDGALVEGDVATAKIAIVEFEDVRPRGGPDGLLAADPASVVPMDNPTVRQGYLETSNVALGEEMIALMEAVRRAETGQRLMNVYDDLMGRAITTFGQASG